MSYDNILIDEATAQLMSSPSGIPSAKRVERTVKHLQTEYDISEAKARDIVCKIEAELVSKGTPAYIDVDNSTAYCLCLREANAKPIYLTLATIYKLVEGMRTMKAE